MSCILPQYENSPLKQELSDLHREVYQSAIDSGEFIQTDNGLIKDSNSVFTKKTNNPLYSLAISELIQLKPINDKFNKVQIGNSFRPYFFCNHYFSKNHCYFFHTKC